MINLYQYYLKMCSQILKVTIFKYRAFLLQFQPRKRFKNRGHNSPLDKIIFFVRLVKWRLHDVSATLTHQKKYLGVNCEKGGLKKEDCEKGG